MKQLKILFTLLVLIAALSSCGDIDDNENIKAKGLIVNYNRPYYNPDTIILNIKCYTINTSDELRVITPGSQYWRTMAKNVRSCKPIY